MMELARRVGLTLLSLLVLFIGVAWIGVPGQPRNWSATSLVVQRKPLQPRLWFQVDLRWASRGSVPELSGTLNCGDEDRVGCGGGVRRADSIGSRLRGRSLTAAAPLLEVGRWWIRDEWLAGSS